MGANKTLSGAPAKSSFFNFLWQAYSVYKGALSAARCYAGDWWACANVIRMLIFDEQNNGTKVHALLGDLEDQTRLPNSRANSRANGTGSSEPGIHALLGGLEARASTRLRNRPTGAECYTVSGGLS